MERELRQRYDANRDNAIIMMMAMRA